MYADSSAGAGHVEEGDLEARAILAVRKGMLQNSSGRNLSEGKCGGCAECTESVGRTGISNYCRTRKEGLEKVSWNGRFTVLDTEPLFVVDGAHNPAAADMLVQSIEHYFKGKRLIYIMGVFSDKDYQSVIRKTAPLADQIFTIQTPNNVRALPAQKLAEAIEKINPHVEAAESVEAAVEKAYGLAEDKDVILAFGSLSFIGIMTEAVEEEREETKGTAE